MGHKLIKSLSTVSLLTACSRVLGFIRDAVVAHVFGASVASDAFYVAFRIPNLMRRLFAEGAFTQAFVPLLAQYRAQRSVTEVNEFIGKIIGNLSLVLLLVTGVGMIAAPVLTLLFAPGFYQQGDQFALTNTILRIVFPYILLISLTACVAGVLNTYQRFAIPAITPILLNIAMISAALWLAPECTPPILGLAWGVLVAGFVQFFFQWPFLARLNVRPTIRIAWRDPAVKTLLKRMVPALLGVSVAQINLLVDTLFASYLPTGSISWLYYADRLMSLPLGIFGVAVATVILPELSRYHIAASQTAYADTVAWGLKLLLLIGVPATIGLMMLAEPLLVTLLQYGEFSPYDVLMTQQSLVAYAIGLQFFMLVKVLAAAYYATGDTSTPARIAMGAMLLNVILNALFIIPLQHVGIALATSLSGIVNTLLLCYWLYRKKLFLFKREFLSFGLRLLVASVVMLMWLWIARGDITQWFAYSWHERVMHLSLLISVALLVYISILLLVGCRLRALVGKRG